MTATAKALLGYMVAVLVVFVWMFRLDVVASSGTVTGFAIITDRWMGTVHHCGGGGTCYRLFPKSN